jgi:hypothetical protein
MSRGERGGYAERARRRLRSDEEEVARGVPILGKPNPDATNAITGTNERHGGEHIAIRLREEIV